MKKHHSLALINKTPKLSKSSRKILKPKKKRDYYWSKYYYFGKTNKKEHKEYLKKLCNKKAKVETEYIQGVEKYNNYASGYQES